MVPHNQKKREAQNEFSRNLRSSSKVERIEGQVRKVDVSDLKSDFDSWHALSIESWESADSARVEPERYDKVLLAGMGGSGLTGELIIDLAIEKKSKISFETIKDYHLPPSCNKRTLVIGMSSSGNTEETLSIMSEAHKLGLRGICFGSGGMIESLSKGKWNYDFIRTKMLKVPRSSLPGIFYPVLKTIVKNDLIKLSSDEVEESIEILGSTKETHGEDDALNFSKRICEAPLFPLIYSSIRTRGVGLRARQSFNENAKIHAFNSEIPELCHNEIVAWDLQSTSSSKRNSLRKTSYPHAIFLRLQDDPIEIATRFEIVEEIVRKASGVVLNTPCRGETSLARILSMLYFLEYASYYCAIKLGVDPIQTPSIHLLKRELSARLNYTAKL